MLNVCMISCILFAFMIVSIMWFPNMVNVKQTTVDEVTRTPIIASAAEALATNDIAALLSNQWETLSPIFETLKEHFNESSEPLIQQLCNSLITRIPIITAPAEVSSPDDEHSQHQDYQKLVDANKKLVDAIQALIKQNTNSTIFVVDKANMFTRVILWLLRLPQHHQVDNLINELFTELNDTKLVQYVMGNLTSAVTKDDSDLFAPILKLMKFLVHYDKTSEHNGWMVIELSFVLSSAELNESQFDEIIDMIEPLVKQNENSKYAEWGIRSLSEVFSSAELNVGHIDKIIAMIKLLIKHADTSKVSVIQHLSQILSSGKLNALQRDTIIALIKPLIKRHKKSDNAQPIIGSLCYVLTYGKLDKSQFDGIIAMIKQLLKGHYLWSDSIIKSLSYVLYSPQLNPDQKDQIQALIETLKSFV